MTSSTTSTSAAKVNVQVVVRCRPLSKEERLAKVHEHIRCHETSQAIFVQQHLAGKVVEKMYAFDKVFGQYSQQEEIFEATGRPMVDEVLQGFNGTIFAYGQTGTGKTFTMEGEGWGADGSIGDGAGLIPRCVDRIFQQLQAVDRENFAIKVSFMEIYNEELTDLLHPNKTDLRMLEENGRVIVRGLHEVFIQGIEDMGRLLAVGIANRRTAETKLNKCSSRSHSIFTITTHIKEATAEGDDLIKIGKLNLVDLAGSENVIRSGARDGRAREAGNINQSLLTLGRVINALVEAGAHVPYRDSKLTRLLRDSLGGTTKTCIVATIAPAAVCQDETTSTLDYALRARDIKNRPTINTKISQKAMVRELTRENERLKLELEVARERDGVFLPLERFKDLEDANGALEDDIRSLQGQVSELQRKLEREEEVRTQLIVAVEERDFLVAYYQKSENALALHGELLQRGLDTVIAERDAATERHKETRTELESLRAAYAQLRAEVAAQADRMTTAAESSATRHAVEIAHVQTHAAQLAESEAQCGELLEGCCAEVAEHVRRLEDSAHRSVDAARETAGAKARDVADLRDQGSALIAAADDVAAVLNEVRAKQEQAQELVRQQAATAGSLASSHVGMSQQARRLAERAPEACGNIEQQLAAASASMQEGAEVEQRLVAFAATVEQALQAQKDAVIGQVMQTCTNLLDGFLQHVHASVSQQVHEAVAASASVRDGAAAQLAGSQAATRELAVALSEDFASIAGDAEACHALAARLEDDAHALASGPDGLGQQSSGVTAAAVKAQATSEGLARNASQLAAASDATAAAWEGAAAELAQQAAAAAAQTGAVVQGAVELCAARHVASAETAQSLGQHAEAAAAVAQAATGDVASGCSQVQSSLQQTSVAETPAKADVAVTVIDRFDSDMIQRLRAPPPQVALAMYHQKLAENGGVPGGDSAWLRELHHAVSPAVRPPPTPSATDDASDVSVTAPAPAVRWADHPLQKLSLDNVSPVDSPICSPARSSQSGAASMQSQAPSSDIPGRPPLSPAPASAAAAAAAPMEEVVLERARLAARTPSRVPSPLASKRTARAVSSNSYVAAAGNKQRCLEAPSSSQRGASRIMASPSPMRKPMALRSPR